MSRNDKIAAVILGAAVTYAAIKFFSLEKEERKELCEKFKNKTNELLTDADTTVDKVNEFIEEYEEQSKEAWMDKFFVVRRMIRSLYGSDKRFFL